MKEQLFCRKCGKELPIDSLFCYKCGTKVIFSDDTEEDENNVSTKTPISVENPAKKRDIPPYEFIDVITPITNARNQVEYNHMIKKNEEVMNQVKTRRSSFCRKGMGNTPYPIRYSQTIPEEMTDLFDKIEKYDPTGKNTGNARFCLDMSFTEWIWDQRALLPQVDMVESMLFPNRVPFGKIVSYVMQENKITVNEFCEKSGIRQAIFKKIMSMPYFVPNREIVLRTCFGVSSGLALYKMKGLLSETGFELWSLDQCDKAIMYFLEEKMVDFKLLDQVLTILGGKPFKEFELRSM